MTNIISLIHSFFDYVDEQNISLYNEFSFQHELGIFLRSNLEGFQIEFERNVSHFGFDKGCFEKKEIDIAIYSKSSRQLLSAIELKYPRNGQVPETMFSFCKDISFLEQLRTRGFESGYFLALVEDKQFYQGQDFGIYSHFRASKPINGRIQKPTGKKDSMVNITGTYSAAWENTHGNKKYCLIEIQS